MSNKIRYCTSVQSEQDLCREECLLTLFPPITIECPFFRRSHHARRIDKRQTLSIHHGPVRASAACPFIGKRHVFSPDTCLIGALQNGYPLNTSTSSVRSFGVPGASTKERFISSFMSRADRKFQFRSNSDGSRTRLIFQHCRCNLQPSVRRRLQVSPSACFS